MRLAINRTRIEAARSSVDKVDGSVEQDHSANKELMPKQAVHTNCSTECQVHLGNSWSGENLQIRVSLGVGDDDKIIWAKPETCQCKFYKTSILNRK